MLRPLATMAGAASLALVGVGLVPLPARATTLAPNYVEHPAGVAMADVLPTTQVNGVVWTQKIVGSTVYVGGEFTSARPAGAAAGTSETPRANLLAYDLTTGVLKTSFVADTNGAVKTLNVSPDGSTLYVGGAFTTIQGVARGRIAAIDLASGKVQATFHPQANQEVDAIASTNTTVYYGGQFTTVDGLGRTRLAASDATTGALTAWAPVADLYVKAMTFTPDGSKLAIGGSFGTVNGATSPGLAFLDPASGTLLPFAANQVVQNHGSSAGIYSLKNDGKHLLATGWWFGGTGNFEGVLSADPSDGSIRWMADCHGDSYDATTLGDYTYSVSHHHTCNNIRSFNEQTPQYRERTQAFTDRATTTVQHNSAGGYHDFYGQPAPSQVDWFPELDMGTYTNQGQAAWSVESSGNYVVEGGEFPKVNGIAQQGLVRFALPGTAPSKVGPLYTWNWNPSALVVGTVVKLSWPANVDRDAMKLTYRVYRKDQPGKVLWSGTQDSAWFERPTMGYLDQSLTAGTSYTYWVTATDPDGNVAQSQKVTVVAGATSVVNTPYSQDVTTDGATHYWRLLESAGSTRSLDWASGNDLQLGTGVTLGQDGATGDGAAAFDGTSNGEAAAGNAEVAPDTFSVELWFKSTSTTGGKLVGFGDQRTGNSGNYDRQVYLDDGGHLWFGVWPGSTRAISSSGSYNDGAWHHVVATLGSDGMILWADGRKVADDPSTTSAQADFTGYWRIGGDQLSGWPGTHGNDIAATIDDVAIYPAVIGRDTVRKHWTDSGRSLTLPSAPADDYGKTVYGDDPSLYYRLDETSGTTAADSSVNMADGTWLTGTAQGLDSSVTDPAVRGSAAGFTNAGSGVVSNLAEHAPKVFSEEAWFRTTTTAGGSIMGFGDSAGTSSGSHDRHVWMSPDGQVHFGTWAGGITQVASGNAYNDGAWHHVVATLGSDGMRLYLDGVLVDSNGNTTTDDYVGHWHIGDDSTWQGAKNLDGAIDEAAVYGKALSLAQVRTHYRAAAGTHDMAPVAAFTADCDNGVCSLDAGASTDLDGTVASWAWDFGDGTTGSGVTTRHTYPTSGIHHVTLTVTDDQGVSSKTSQDVQVTIPVQPPVPQLDATCTNLACSFDSKNSTTPGSTVKSVAWDFGDGATSTEASPVHTYAKAGSYTVKLTVTAANGQAASTTKEVTVVANQAPTAAFTTTVDDLTAHVDASTSADADGSIASYAWDFGDGSTGTGVKADHTYPQAGSYTVTLTVTDDQGATSTRTATVVASKPADKPPVATFEATMANHALSVDASGSSDPDGTVTDYAWDFGDGSTGTGARATHDYLAAGAYTVTLTVTDDAGQKTTTTRAVTATDAPNQAPTASFTHTETGLTSDFDASASADADGTIANYGWDFGDGSTATGRTVEHDYTKPGTYTATLTVTDDGGARAVATQQVTVDIVSTPANTTPLASDDFSTTGSGWGTADNGGSWTYPTGGSVFSRDGKVGRITLKPAATGRAVLAGVAAGDATLTADLTIDQLTSGSGAYTSFIQRWSSAGYYSLGVRHLATGGVDLVVYRTLNGATTTLKEVTVKGLAYTPGSVVHVRFQVTGSGTTTLAGSAWADGQTAPASPQVSVTDSSAALQGTGGVGVNAYLSSSATQTRTVGLDNLVVTAG